ncbi:MAG: bifunctional ADP-dependent NAD(P)H-hydrate dehydratase/NAD(P)H-hydrate epimerase, partial [Schaalia odontolytica]|nr:bifunctional ADP-dependent NAD(P)H-hydrate dehydratase/NAD(P)H-hydrate epimerase [Schaalia odontolytica]
MFTIDRAALSFADARELETTCVDQAVSEGDPDRYMLDVASEVAAAVVRHADLPVSWNGEDSEPGVDAEERGDAEGGDWIASRVTAFVGGGDNGGD